MREGEVIMNNEAGVSTDRALRVFRGDDQLTSDGVFTPGETLRVEISDEKGQFVIETSAGSFEDGGCDGRRVIVSPANLVLPSGSAEVALWAGWAYGHSQVLISPHFVLRLKDDPHAEHELKIKSKNKSKIHKIKGTFSTCTLALLTFDVEDPKSLRGAMKLLRRTIRGEWFLYGAAFLVFAVVLGIVFKFCFRFRQGKFFSKSS